MDNLLLKEIPLTTIEKLEQNIFVNDKIVRILNITMKHNLTDFLNPANLQNCEFFTWNKNKRITSPLLEIHRRM